MSSTQASPSVWFSGSCPSCTKPMSQALLSEVAEDAAQSHIEGGDSFNGGEVYASCPFCKGELVLVTEGHTETTRYAKVEKVVSIQ